MPSKTDAVLTDVVHSGDDASVLDGPPSIALIEACARAQPGCLARAVRDSDGVWQPVRHDGGWTERAESKVVWVDGEAMERALKTPVYTWRTDAVSGAKQYTSTEALLGELERTGEWPEVGSKAEKRLLADGAWLCVYEDGVPVLVIGEMP